MIVDALKASSVEKLKGILKDRYGLGLQVQFLLDLDKVKSVTDIAVADNGDLEIPINANGEWMAQAVIPEAGKLHPEDVPAIADMVRLVLEPTLYKWILEQKEVNQRSQPSWFKTELFAVPEEESSDRLSLISSILILRSKTPMTITKIAMEIHDITNRWAYLSLKDVASGIKTLEDIKSVGPITLFVEKDEDLTPEQRELLSQYSLNSNPDEHPLILIGTSDQKNSHLSDLQAVKIDLDRLPKNMHELRETLALLLDREASLN